MVITGVLGSPVTPPGGPVSGTAARRAARAELTRPEYRRGGPGVLDRVGHWISRQLGHLLGAGGGAGHALLLVLLVLLVGAVLLAARAGLPGRRGRAAHPDGVDPLSAADSRDHRRIAAGYEAVGQYAQALREWLRAAVATIEERGVLPVRPGRTGARTAAEAGPLLPAAAAELATAMAAFDEVWFGGRTATADDAHAARAAADAVRSARLRATTAAGVPDGPAAPW